MLEGEKNNMQAHTPRKDFIVSQGVEEKIHDYLPNHPTPPPPPPPEVKWLAS